MPGLNGNRVALNTNGAMPLADTSLGTAGTVTGTERALVQSAQNLNTANSLVKRDASGNFSATTITAALAGNATTATSVPGVGTLYEVNLASSTAIPTGETAILTLTPAAGTYIVTGQMRGPTANLEWLLYYNGVRVESGLWFNDTGGEAGAIVSPATIVCNGSASLSLRAAPLSATSVYGGGARTFHHTYLRAVRIA